jgi:hypothetical protein
MERPAREHVLPLQVVATVVPAPSTDSFDHYEPGYESASLKYTKQVPRLGYPHWAVTSEVVPQNLPGIRCYERSEYGEITYIGERRPY